MTTTEHDAWRKALDNERAVTMRYLRERTIAVEYMRLALTALGTGSGLASEYLERGLAKVEEGKAE